MSLQLYLEVAAALHRLYSPAQHLSSAVCLTAILNGAIGRLNATCALTWNGPV